MATQLTKSTWGAFLGSAVEWYDFFLYGTASALIFNKIFFSSNLDPTAASILSLLTFAAGFLARPLGAVIFGHLGDTIGRKNTFVITLLIMGVSTVLIGFLPTYSQVGLAAPLMLLTLRIIQGIGVGGEWGGAVLVTIENAPPKWRAFFGVAPQLGSPAGTIMANGAFFLVALLPEEDLLSWGWRIPFWASSILILIGLVVRFTVGETEEYSSNISKEGKSSNPVGEVLTQAWGRILLVAGSRLFELTGFTVATVFIATYVVNDLHGNRSDALQGVFWGGVAELITLPLFAVAMLKFKAEHVIYTGALLGIIMSFPFFILINQNTSFYIWLAMVMWFPIVSLPFAAYPTVFARLFPSSIRYSGISIGYQTVALFSGFVPAFLTWLYATSGSWISIAVFVSLTAVVSLCCTLAMTKISKN